MAGREKATSVMQRFDELDLASIKTDIPAFRAGDTVNVHVKVPPVGFDTLMGLASGEGPPAVPEKLKLVGLSRMLGVTVRLLLPLVTTKVTGTDVTCILLFFSAMAMRTVPL